MGEGVGLAVEAGVVMEVGDGEEEPGDGGAEVGGTEAEGKREEAEEEGEGATEGATVCVVSVTVRAETRLGGRAAVVVSRRTSA